MIRLIQRRLIIPRGDTGSFTIPAIAAASNTDVAIFTIFDCVTRSKLFEKTAQPNGETLVIEFTHNDTVNLVPGKYVWDIKFYKNPQYADGELVNGDEIDSYYAGYSLPECEIRETADDLLISPNAPNGTLTPSELNIISAALASLSSAVAQTESNVSHYPIIQDETWYVWDAAIENYVSTEVPANGIVGNGISSAILNNDYTLTINFTDETSYTTPSIRGMQGEIGPTPNITIGSVTEAADPSASITGTAENPVLNLVLPNAYVPTHVSELENDSGYLTSFTEVDPTVPSWAKAPTKPTYTPQEVGALPDNTFIPSQVSDLVNDVGYISSHQDISGKLDVSLKGAANGLAELDSNGKVPAAQLPSYVDDVIEVSSMATLPATGENGKIYVTLDNNLTYRWSGSNYVEISASLALGETEATAYRGDRGKVAYDHAMANGSAFESGLYKIATNVEGHITSAELVTKEDIIDLGIPVVVVPGTSNGSVKTADYISSSGKLRSNTSTAGGSFAEGINTTASGPGSHSEGQVTIASGPGSHAEGLYTEALGDASHTEGSGSKTIDMYGHAEGYQTIADIAAHAEGVNTVAVGTGSHAEGRGAYVELLLTGEANTKTYNYTYVSETNNDTNFPILKYRLIFYNNTTYWVDTANKTNSTLTLDKTLNETEAISDLKVKYYLYCTYANYSHIEGYNQFVSTAYGHAEGSNCIVRGQNAHAEVSGTKALNNATHSEGSYTVALGAYSHAEGNHTLTAGRRSHAEGQGDSISINVTYDAGDTTFTFTGSTNFNAGDILIMEYSGDSTIITAVDKINMTATIATAMSNSYRGTSGQIYNSYTKGVYSHVEGLGTISNGAAEHAQGMYNVSSTTYPKWVANTSYEVGDRVTRTVSEEDKGYECITANSDASFTQSKWKLIINTTDSAFIIGNGSSNSQRSNALTVDWDGTGHFGGDIYVNCDDLSSGGVLLATVDDLTSAMVEKADKADTVLETTLSRGRIEGSTIGEASFAFGNDVIAAGPYSHAEGYGTENYGYAAHTEGYGTKVIYSCGHAEGLNTYAYVYAHSEGSSTFTGNNGAHAEGAGSMRTIYITGEANATTYSYSVAAAGDNDINKLDIIVAKNHVATIASVDRINNTITVNTTLVEAFNNTQVRVYKYYAIGLYSHTEGDRCTARGAFSHAEGSESTTLGYNSHAEGSAGKALGNVSHAEGTYTVALGNYSHSENNHTLAYGKNSHAEGNGESLSLKVYGAEDAVIYSYTGTYDPNVGDYISDIWEFCPQITSVDIENKQITVSSSFQRYKNGESMYVYQSGAFGEASHVEGKSTISKGLAQHVQGKYNIIDNNELYADIVGNGTSHTNRSNAYALTWSGDGKYAGDVYVHANADSSSGTKLATVEDIPEVPVTDVQINGTSILSSGVANVPVATTSAFGVVKIGLGLVAADGSISVSGAGDSDIKSGTSARYPITPKRQHISTFYGLAKAAGDSTQSASSNAVGTYTSEAKTAIKTMIGIQEGLEVVRLI